MLGEKLPALVLGEHERRMAAIASPRSSSPRGDSVRSMLRERSDQEKKEWLALQHDIVWVTYVRPEETYEI